LQAVAALAWVCFAFTVLIVFRPEIAKALGRLRSAQILGQKVELRDELIKLESSAAASANIVRELAPVESRTIGIGPDEKFEDTIRAILEQAASSPKVALMTLGAEIEKQSLQGLAIRGMLRDRSTVSTQHALSELRQYGFPQNLQGSLDLFNNVRNKIIHGAEATDNDALKAIDSGMTILRTLNAMPKEVNVVHHPGVDIFSDAACSRPITNAKGLIVEVTSPGGVIKTKRIYPTTRTHFQRGRQLAWEWNLSRQWPAAWYRDPDTGEIKSAWGSSVEFIGRHLDDISPQ
jgi:hypothetical protein